MAAKDESYRRQETTLQRRKNKTKHKKDKAQKGRKDVKEEKAGTRTLLSPTTKAAGPILLLLLASLFVHSTLCVSPSKARPWS